ncbi:unnamed protein product [Brassica rapa subsp. narinosa]
MAWAWNLCVGFLLVLLWSWLLPLALVLVSCVKLIEFSPVPFFGVLFLFRFESASSLVLKNGLCCDSPIRVGHSDRTCLHVIEPIIPALDP